MSELITPEEFIKSKEFIDALKNINKEFETILVNMSKASVLVKAYYTEVEKGAGSTKKLDENQKLANATTKETARLENELIKTKAKIATATSDVNKQLNEEKKKLKEVNDSVKGVTDSEKARLKNIGKYKEDIVKAYVAIKGSIYIAKEAVLLFVDTLKSTGSGADAFKFTLEGIHQGFNRIKVAVSTLDFKDFMKNVGDAIREGKRYAEGLDEVDDKTRALRVAEAQGAAEVLRQREIQNDVRKSLEERNKAGKEAIRIEDELQKIRTGIADQAYKNELDNITSLANPGKVLTDQMRNEILLYQSRDKGIMESIENGKKFKQQLDRIAQTGNNYNEILFNQNKYKEENAASLKDYELLLRVTIPTDEKYTELMRRQVELENAKVSGIENTLRVRAKQSKTEENIVKDQATIEKEASELTLKNWEKVWTSEEDATEDGMKRAKEMDDSIKKYNEEKVKSDKEAQEKIDKQDEENHKKFLERKEKEKQAIEDSKQIALESANLIFDVGAGFRSREMQEIETKRDKELKSAGDNTKKKEKIEADYEKKINALKRKQAIADRVQALFNIAINTQVAVSKTLATAGWLGIPLTTWIRLQGLLQAAAVMAQPLPKFFKGVKDFKGGVATVGEKGMELVETPKGSFLTPDKATTMLLPEHSTVHTHEKTIEKLKEMDSSKVNELINEQRATRRAIENQVHNSTTLTQDGLEYARIKGNSRTKMIDKYFRT